MTDQDVERTTRPTRVRWYRFAARGLVVAGFAGGVWLLTSTAAHAASDAGPRPAPRAAASTGTTVEWLLTGLDNAIAPAGHHRGLLARVLGASGGRPVARSGRPVPPAVATHATAGRTGAAMAPPASRLSGLLTPVLLLAGPVLRPVSTVLTPVTGVLDGVTDSVVTPVGGTATWLMDQLAARWLVPVSRPFSASAGTAAGAPSAAQPAGGRESLRHSVAHSTAVRGSQGRAARIGRTHLPILPRPAPLPAYPDPGQSGMPTASVSQHGGGSATAVHTAVVSAPVAVRRLSTVVEVEVRRLIAEAPTVSPD